MCTARAGHGVFVALSGGMGVVNLNTVLFQFLGWSWTVPMLLTAFIGAIGLVKGLVWLHLKIMTLEQRRLTLLHQYLDKEEKDITSKRRDVLTGIKLAHHAYLDEKQLDVSKEIDAAVKLLDDGRPDRAQARLSELRNRISNNSQILQKRIGDLKKHERSIDIFLAAVADKDGKVDEGLAYINSALRSDGFDTDALNYKGQLHLKKNEFDLAEGAFRKLLINNEGSPINRANAHLGLGRVALSRGRIGFESAAQSLENAITNLNSLAPEQQDPFTQVAAHEMLAKLYCDQGWDKRDAAYALENVGKARIALKRLPQANAVVAQWRTVLNGLLWQLESKTDSNVGAINERMQ